MNITPELTPVQQDNLGPGSVLAKNTSTGVEHYIRPDMLQIEGNPWEVIDHEALARATGKQAQKAAKPEGKDVVTTADGKPFKTEAAARSAMTTKKLDENEWIILPLGEKGFIITKV
jgi:hypothetical protein